MKSRIIAGISIILVALIAFFALDSNKNFSYGLDLSGGTRLTYSADTSQVDQFEVNGAMDVLRQTIEKRINIFGVSEPIVSVENAGSFSDDKNQNRLSIELPGVTDVESAINSIGATPLLEFRLEKEDTQDRLALLSLGTPESRTPEQIKDVIYNSYVSSGLTGGQLERATVVFGQQVGYAQISLKFNSDASKLLADITRENMGKQMAIFLDGNILSAPVIQAEIFSGEAQITGDFSPEEAKELVQNLNFGALPLPISLIETNTIGPSLGQETLQAGTKALMIAFALIFIFLVAIYRIYGLVATISLASYVLIMLGLFKFIPVTLTASGIAGFILSIGMAVDANVLIFERIKDEKKKNKSKFETISEGFNRAWPAIRDGNFTSLISAVILFWMSDASVVKGFALVFGLGVLVSMLTAVFLTKNLLLAFVKQNNK
ncbi:MAG: protein translocase subunit SecD [Candidatus Paceibacterota bacterium]